VLSWKDAHGLREHYARLVALRREYAVLRLVRLKILATSHPENVLAYLRPGEQREQDIIVLLNHPPFRLSLRAHAHYGGLGEHSIPIAIGKPLPAGVRDPEIFHTNAQKPVSAKAAAYVAGRRKKLSI
jgi:hypothetical protein